MFNTLRISPLVAVVLLGGCVALPTGPSVMALPGTGKNFDQFRSDDGAVHGAFGRGLVRRLAADLKAP